MTAERPPDDADRPARSPADATAPDERRRARPLRSRLSTPRVGLLALVVCLAVVGAVAAGPGVAALSPDGPAQTDDAEQRVDTEQTADTAEPAALTPGGPEAATGADRADLSGGFSRSVYTGVAGDPVDVRYTADAADGDEAYLLVGGNRLTDTGESVGYVDVIKVTGSEDAINTRTLGTNETDAESCGNEDVDCDLEFRNEDGDVIAENLSELSGATGAGGLPRPLTPQRYRLAITNGTFVVEDSGQVTPVEMAARAELVLEEPTLHEEVEVFTTADREALPDADPDDDESLDAIEENGLDRTAVTEGDRVVLGFESSGIWGALSHYAGSTEDVEAGREVNHTVLTDLLDAEEGVSLRVRQTNPGRNQAPSELDLSDADPDDVSLILADAAEGTAGEDDPTAGRFYLVVDTGSDAPFTRPPEPGDEFAVEFALEGTEGERYAFADGREPPAAFEPASSTDDDVPEQFPYWETADDTVTAEASFSVRERFIRYDNVTDDGELLVEAEGGTVTGTTSLLPVEELAANFVNDAGEPIRTESPMDVSDGNFTIDADFDGVSPGTRLNYELYEGSSLRDSRTVVVVDDADDPDRLAIENASTNVTVPEDGNLSALEVDVRNAGGLEGEGTLAVDVDDGNLTASRELTLDSNESRTVAFSSAAVDLDPGEYPFTVTLDDDSRNGTLTVDEDASKTTLDDADESTDDDSDGENESADGGDEANASEPDSGDEANASEPDSGDDANRSDDDSDGSEETDEPDDGQDDPDEDAGSTGFLPFGIGTRETLGGTVVVGATYLLGHWV